MSTDLRTRLDRAVGPLEPRPVDTGELWQRGRRQRRAKRATPVLAVLAIVGLGLGAVVAVSHTPRDTGPVAPIEDGRVAGLVGWTRVAPGAVVTADDVVVADEGDIEVTSAVLGHPMTTFGGFDVREDGAVVSVFHERETGGIAVRYPEDASWTVLGMPAPFLSDDAGFALHSLQWGPDGRIYVTGMAPTASGRGVGLTQVAVLEEDGTVVGVRENDDGQTNGLLFVDGYAWQRQGSRPGEERWQPVAEVGGRVLQMPEQRAGEWDDTVAPDGLTLGFTVDGAGAARLRGLAGGAEVEWTAGDDGGIGVWDHATAGRRVAASVPMRPARGVLSWLTDDTEPDGVVLQVLGADGGIAAVHLPAGVIDEPWGMVNGADAIVGRDGRVHWVTHSPGGPVIRSYRHPLP